MLLAIDPGITTAWAILSLDTWEILATGTCQPEEIQFLQPSILQDRKITRTVIEDTPIPTHSQMNRDLRAVLAALRAWYPDARWVRPGEWKNHSVAHTPVPSGLTIHEKDACRLGLYDLATRPI